MDALLPLGDGGISNKPLDDNFCLSNKAGDWHCIVEEEEEDIIAGNGINCDTSN
jgi:hypothetical protein